MTPTTRNLLRTAGVALGATSIYWLWLLAPLVTGRHSAVYHWSGSALELFVPPTLDFCVFWLLLTLLLLLTGEPGRLRATVWCGIIAFTPWIAIKNGTYLSNTPLNHTFSVTLFSTALLTFVGSLVLWNSSWEARFERVIHYASRLLLLPAMSGVAVLCAVGWYGWQARSLNAEFTPRHTAHAEVTHAAKPRIIWIVFDELSYQQVYERRFPGLNLPAFDGLAAQSTVFTHAIPAGILTERILPSLMTGTPVDGVRSSPDGRQLYLRNLKTNDWQQFDEHDTVFQDALNLNYRTAVVGWYNPYCRILPDVLDHCYWTFGAAAKTLSFPRATFQSNLAMPLMQFVGMGPGYRIMSFFRRAPRLEELDVQQHISDYVDLEAATNRILDNPSAEFTLIHLPVPHPYGIYDRRADTFVTMNASYLDNLALADKLLGHIRGKLEKSGQWDASTIVLMGDHSWRTQLYWSGSWQWTKEEQITSHGGEFDDRPAYVVKLPDQQTGTRIDAAFDALETRRLFDALLAQKIRNADDLVEWAKRGGN
jgi:hypothetical protein